MSATNDPSSGSGGAAPAAGAASASGASGPAPQDQAAQIPSLASAATINAKATPYFKTLSLVQQAKVKQLQRHVGTLTAKLGASDKTVVSMKNSIAAGTMLANKMGMFRDQASVSLPAVPADGWVIHGHVRDSSFNPVPRATVALVNQQKAWIQNYGYAFTDATGYFILTYTPAQQTAVAAPTGLTASATGDAAPAAGSTAPTASGAAPATGTTVLTTESVAPTSRSGPPATGAAAPTVGSAAPTVGSAAPTVGSAAPINRSETAAPETAAPTTGTTVSEIGSATPASGAAPAAASTTGAGASATNATYLQVLNERGQTLYLDSSAFTPTTGPAVYRAILLSATGPLGDAPGGAVQPPSPPSSTTGSDNSGSKPK